MKSALEIIADALRADTSDTFANVEMNGDEILVEINGAPYAVKTEAI